MRVNFSKTGTFQSSILLTVELAQPSCSPVALVIVVGQVYWFCKWGKKDLIV